ncbi:hypothetical protein HDV01_003212 [Terramyces sp. JEL0728]|nr:hypothetical protein HDV01_003212 [Terramyces sp. JEL0728]
MGPFTVGYTLSTAPFQVIDYSSPLAVISIIVALIYLFSFVGMLVFIARGWVGVRAKVLYFIWIVNSMGLIWCVLNIITHVPIVTPFTSWLYNVFGVLNIYVTVIGQLDILKAFSTGTGHILFMTVMFKMIRVVNLRSSGSSSSHVNNSTVHAGPSVATPIAPTPK